MQAPDLDLLSLAAQEAGKIAKGYAGQKPKQWQKPDNAGPVTEADLAVNDFLYHFLEKKTEKIRFDPLPGGYPTNVRCQNDRPDCPFL